MEKSKVISVRVPNKVLEELEDVAKNSEFYNKSDFINAGIKLVLVAHKLGKSRDILRFFPEYGDVVDEFKFGYHRDINRR